MDRDHRILFASPYCLLDITSGAAHATQELLDELAQQGFESQAVTASIFDPSHEVLLDEIIPHHGAKLLTSQGTVNEVPFIEVSHGRLIHTILKTMSSRRFALKTHEEGSFLSLVERKINEFKPEILLTYGGLSTERRIHLLAKQFKIPVVFYLHNSEYMKVETFSDVDLILVPSKFLSEFYARRLGLPSQVIYPLFKSCHSLVTYRNPRFVTFINPVPQKGLTLFARIVAEALRKLPQAQFLVVEGRWKLDNVERAGLKLEKIPNVKVIPHQQDIKEVYAETRVLLFPSLEVEAFGRILVETQWNGIPILASRRGGIPEALNGGGFLFDIPDRCTENYLAIPTPEEVQPWIDQLRVLLEDQRGYEEAQRRAIQAAEAFSPERTIQTVINLFHRLLKK